MSLRKKKQEKEQVPATPLDKFPSSFLAIPLLQTSKATGNSYVKYLFCKSKVEDSGEYTLIVVNRSVDDTKSSLKHRFESLLGQTVNKVELGKDRMALVMFNQNVESRLRKLTKEQCLETVIEEEVNKPTCIEQWLEEYKRNRPDRASIGRAADERVAELDRIEKEQEELRRQPQVDEDGFTLVVSKKKRATLPSVPTTEHKLASNKRPLISGVESKKKKGRIIDEKLSFYKFEKKLLRNKELTKLKDQFKNDRKRAARLKNEIANSTAEQNS